MALSGRSRSTIATDLSHMEFDAGKDIDAISSFDDLLNFREDLVKGIYACGFDQEPLLDVDFADALDGFLEASLTDATLSEVLNSYGPPNVDVLHDCMWSGLGLEDTLTLNASTPAMAATPRNNFSNRAETPLLGSSPPGIAAFGDMLTSCTEMDVATETCMPSMDDDESSDSQTSTASSGFVSGNETGLINDHSYGSPKPCVRSSTAQSLLKQQQQSQSLIYPSPVNYRKVLTRTRNGIKPKKVDKEYSPNENTTTAASQQQVSVKFVRRKSFVLKDSTISYSKKPVGKVNGAAMTKKSLGALGLKQPLTYNSTGTSNKHHNSTSSSCSSSPSQLSSCSSSSRSSTSSTVSSSSSSSSRRTNGTIKSSQGGSKTSKPMYPERRREHNDSERKRRDHLRDAFHTLRDQIPKLKETQKKPARITILHEASSYVGQLIEKHRYLESTKEAELKKREKLLKKLADLRSQL